MFRQNFSYIKTRLDKYSTLFFWFYSPPLHKTYNPSVTYFSASKKRKFQLSFSLQYGLGTPKIHFMLVFSIAMTLFSKISEEFTNDLMLSFSNLYIFPYSTKIFIFFPTPYFPVTYKGSGASYGHLSVKLVTIAKAQCVWWQKVWESWLFFF